MKDRGDADAGPEMPWVGRYDLHRLGRRSEQQIVEERLVLKREGADLGREGEDDMEIADME